jgi:hypothetical protein
MNVSIDFNGITLKLYEGEKLWLEMPDGEGMEVSTVEIEKLLKEYYDGNF